MSFDCSPKIILRKKDGTLIKDGYENLFRTFNKDLVKIILVVLWGATALKVPFKLLSSSALIIKLTMSSSWIQLIIWLPVPKGTPRNNLNKGYNFLSIEYGWSVDWLRRFAHSHVYKHLMLKIDYKQLNIVNSLENIL